MTDQKHYSCQGCDRDDLTLTKNGRVRSHAPNGKRVGPDNPACPEGSNFPVQDTEFHTHRYQYGDDGMGHEGSVCTVDRCGMAEPENDPLPETGLADDPAQLVPPNPFRDPAPGGVWDVTGTGRPEIPRKAPERFADVIKEVTRPAGPANADDFLDGSDDEYADTEPAGDGGAFYWPARYDGTCTTCLSHFDSGDMIRKVDGEYEAQDCCGQGAAPRPEVPKAVARTLPVVRGRYKLPHPETGKPVSASRSSKYAEGIADSYTLDQWRHRMILAGLVNDPEILEKVASAMRDKEPLDVVKAEREFLNRMAENAMSAAGGDIRSGAGTKLHKYTEEVDAGTRELADVPEEYRPDATAYRLALAECGFRPVKGLIERSVYCDELKVSGTFDRVLECVRTTDVLDLDGRLTTIHEGEFVIGDVKSGDNIKHPWLEILIQESIYAHGFNENGVAVQDEPGGPFRWAAPEEFGVKPVREDVGVVMHVPYGSGECKFYAADLITGWRGAKICKDNRDFWKIKLPKVPIATYAVTDVEPGEPVKDEPEESLDQQEREAPAQAARNIMDAVHNAKHAVIKAEDVPAPLPVTDSAPYEQEAPVDNSPVTDPWEGRFRAVRTREAANTVWREAKEAGLPAAEIKRLVGLVKLEDPKAQEAPSRPPEPAPAQPVADEGGSRQSAAQDQDGPTLTERAHAVTTKAEASKIFHEAKAKIGTLPEEKRPAAREYLDKLVSIMQTRLKSI